MTTTSMTHRPSPATSVTRNRPIPWRWWATGAVLMAAGLALGAFLMRVGAPRSGELTLDEIVGAHHVGVLDTAAVALALLFGPVVAPLSLLAASAAVWRRNRPAALTLFTVTSVGWLSVGVGKLIYHRARPPFALVHALAFEGKADSFPSGHAAFAVALTLGVAAALHVARRSTRLAWLVGVPVSVLVAASRVYAGVHYLGDVLAAPLFAGGAVALLIAAWLSVPRPRRTAWIGRLFVARPSGA